MVLFLLLLIFLLLRPLCVGLMFHFLSFQIRISIVSELMFYGILAPTIIFNPIILVRFWVQSVHPARPAARFV
jgi:hypothetical protein